MGNRAVITTEENFNNNGVGVYLHWNGGRDSVQAFLKYCKLKGYRAPETDCYGWARLCQVCANFFGGSFSIGIDTVDRIGCNDFLDNGVYIIENWEIVGRKFFDNCEEQDEYDLNEMLLAIDGQMPEHDQIGKDYLSAKVIKPSEMQVGDVVAFLDWDGGILKARVVGIGKDEVVNGHNVKGIPYIARWNLDNHPSKNVNNYLFDESTDKAYKGKEYRLIKRE